MKRQALIPIAQAAFWAWFFALRYTEALEFDIVDCAVMVALSMASAAALAGGARRFGPYSARLWVVLGAAGLSALATVAKLMLSDASPVLLQAMARGFACGGVSLGTTVLYLASMELLARYSVLQTGRLLSVSVLGTLCLGLALGRLPMGGPFESMVVALPLLWGGIVGLLCAGGRSRMDARCARAPRKPPSHGLKPPVRPVILMSAVEFAGCFATFPLVAEAESSISLGIGAVAVGAALLAACLLAPNRFDVRLMYFVSLPVLTMGLLASPLASDWGSIAPFALVNSGYLGFVALSTIVMNENCRRYCVPPAWAFGFLRIAVLLSQLAGAFIVYLIGEKVLDPSIVKWFYSLAMLLVVVASMLFLNAHAFMASWRLGDGGATREGSAQLPSLEGRCALLARTYGLTRREEEVVVAIASGMTVPKAADALFVSKETVKSHLKHVYAKLGVHAKEELLERVEGIGSL